MELGGGGVDILGYLKHYEDEGLGRGPSKVSKIATMFQFPSENDDHRDEGNGGAAPTVTVVRTESHLARFNTARALFEKMAEKKSCGEQQQQPPQVTQQQLPQQRPGRAGGGVAASSHQQRRPIGSQPSVGHPVLGSRGGGGGSLSRSPSPAAAATTASHSLIHSNGHHPSSSYSRKPAAPQMSSSISTIAAISSSSTSAFHHHSPLQNPSLARTGTSADPGEATKVRWPPTTLNPEAPQPGKPNAFVDFRTKTSDVSAFNLRNGGGGDVLHTAEVRLKPDFINCNNTHPKNGFGGSGCGNADPSSSTHEKCTANGKPESLTKPAKPTKPETLIEKPLSSHLQNQQIIQRHKNWFQTFSKTKSPATSPNKPYQSLSPSSSTTGTPEPRSPRDLEKNASYDNLFRKTWKSQHSYDDLLGGSSKTATEFCVKGQQQISKKQLDDQPAGIHNDWRRERAAILKGRSSRHSVDVDSIKSPNDAANAKTFEDISTLPSAWSPPKHYNETVTSSSVTPHEAGITTKTQPCAESPSMRTKVDHSRASPTIAAPTPAKRQSYVITDPNRDFSGSSGEAKKVASEVTEVHGSSQRSSSQSSSSSKESCGGNYRPQPALRSSAVDLHPEALEDSGYHQEVVLRLQRDDQIGGDRDKRLKEWEKRLSQRDNRLSSEVNGLYSVQAWERTARTAEGAGGDQARERTARTAEGAGGDQAWERTARTAEGAGGDQAWERTARTAEGAGGDQAWERTAEGAGGEEGQEEIEELQRRHEAIGNLEGEELEEIERRRELEEELENEARVEEGRRKRVKELELQQREEEEEEMRRREVEKAKWEREELERLRKDAEELERQRQEDLERRRRKEEEFRRNRKKVELERQLKEKEQEELEWQRKDELLRKRMLEEELDKRRREEEEEQLRRFREEELERLREEELERMREEELEKLRKEEELERLRREELERLRKEEEELERLRKEEELERLRKEEELERLRKEEEELERLRKEEELERIRREEAERRRKEEELERLRKEEELERLRKEEELERLRKEEEESERLRKEEELERLRKEEELERLRKEEELERIRREEAERRRKEEELERQLREDMARKKREELERQRMEEELEIRKRKERLESQRRKEIEKQKREEAEKRRMEELLEDQKKKEELEKRRKENEESERLKLAEEEKLKRQRWDSEVEIRKREEEKEELERLRKDQQTSRTNEEELEKERQMREQEELEKRRKGKELEMRKREEGLERRRLEREELAMRKREETKRRNLGELDIRAREEIHVKSRREEKERGEHLEKKSGEEESGKGMVELEGNERELEWKFIEEEEDRKRRIIALKIKRRDEDLERRRNELNELELRRKELLSKKPENEEPEKAIKGEERDPRKNDSKREQQQTQELRKTEEMLMRKKEEDLERKRKLEQDRKRREEEKRRGDLEKKWQLKREKLEEEERERRERDRLEIEKTKRRIAELKRERDEIQRQQAVRLRKLIKDEHSEEGDEEDKQTSDLEPGVFSNRPEAEKYSYKQLELDDATAVTTVKYVALDVASPDDSESQATETEDSSKRETDSSATVESLRGYNKAAMPENNVRIITHSPKRTHDAAEARDNERSDGGGGRGTEETPKETTDHKSTDEVYYDHTVLSAQHKIQFCSSPYNGPQSNRGEEEEEEEEEEKVVEATIAAASSSSHFDQFSCSTVSSNFEPLPPPIPPHNVDPATLAPSKDSSLLDEEGAGGDFRLPPLPTVESHIVEPEPMTPEEAEKFLSHKLPPAAECVEETFPSGVSFRQTTADEGSSAAAKNADDDDPDGIDKDYDSVCVDSPTPENEDYPSSAFLKHELTDDGFVVRAKEVLSEDGVHYLEDGHFWIQVPGLMEDDDDEIPESVPVHKHTKLKFSTEPIKLYSTFSVADYDRRNDDVDPVAASAEYELEKRVEKMNVFPVCIEKGEGGLGLSIIGMGVGADAGVEKLGIFVKTITPDGATDRDGKIKVNDQIIEVDNQSLVGVTQLFAATVLKNTSGTVNFMIGRENDPENSEVAMLIRQSLLADQERDERRRALEGPNYDPRNSGIFESFSSQSGGESPSEETPRNNFSQYDDRRDPNMYGEEEYGEEFGDPYGSCSTSPPEGVTSPPPEAFNHDVEGKELLHNNEMMIMSQHLQEIQHRNEMYEEEISMLRSKINDLEKDFGERTEMTKRLHETTVRLKDVEDKLQSRQAEIATYQDMLEQSQGQYIILEKKYYKAKKIIKEYQSRERDFLHREEYHITQLEEKDALYNSLVKALKDRVIQLEGDLIKAQQEAGIPINVPPDLNSQSSNFVQSEAHDNHSPLQKEPPRKPSTISSLDADLSDTEGGDTHTSEGSKSSTVERKIPSKEELDVAVPPTELLDNSFSKAKGELASRGGLAKRQLPSLKKTSSSASANSFDQSLDDVVDENFAEPLEQLPHTATATPKSLSSSSAHQEEVFHCISTTSSSSTSATVSSTSVLHTHSLKGNGSSGFSDRPPPPYQASHTQAPPHPPSPHHQPPPYQPPPSAPHSYRPVVSPDTHSGRNEAPYRHAPPIARVQPVNRVEGLANTPTPPPPSLHSQHHQQQHQQSLAHQLKALLAEREGNVESMQENRDLSPLKKSPSSLMEDVRRAVMQADMSIGKKPVISGPIHVSSTAQVVSTGQFVHNRASPQKVSGVSSALQQRISRDSGTWSPKLGSEIMSNPSGSVVLLSQRPIDASLPSTQEDECGAMENKSTLCSGDSSFDSQLSLEKISSGKSSKETSVFDWTKEQVAQWLVVQGLENYVSTFVSAGITGPRLINIDSKDLKNLGLSTDDKNKIKRKVKELRQNLEKERKQIEKENKEREKLQKKAEKLAEKAEKRKK